MFSTNSETIDTPPPPRDDINSNSAIMIKPKRSILIYTSYALSLSNEPMILEPSSGGMGIRLKIPSPRLMIARYVKNSKMISLQITDISLCLQV